MLTIDRFLERCRAAVMTKEAEREVHGLVEELISDPASVAAALPEPQRAGFEVLYRSPTLTVLDFTWPPWISFKPHNHRMWSVVGIFSGREENIFWRRATNRIEAAGARSLGVGEVAALGPDVIHSVLNPLGKMTRAIHVYGGDFFAPPEPRSEWNPETLRERPWNMDDTQRLFIEAQARSLATAGGHHR